MSTLDDSNKENVYPVDLGTRKRARQPLREAATAFAQQRVSLEEDDDL